MTATDDYPSVAGCSPSMPWNSGKSATFDFSNLRRDKPYSVLDQFPDDRDYQYYFQICGVVQPNDAVITVPESPNFGQTPCTDRTKTLSPVSPRVAYQIARSNNKCYAIGDTSVASPSMSVALISDNDPTQGVIVTYDGGDVCNSPPGKPMRKLRVYLECDHTPEDIEDKPVSEGGDTTTGKCVYDIHIKTQQGCPRECAVAVGGRLCNYPNGKCGITAGSGMPGCICNNGYSGTDCNGGGGDGGGSSGGITALLVILVLLVAALVAGAGYYYWFHLRRRDLAAADQYKKLHEGGTALMSQNVTTVSRNNGGSDRDANIGDDYDGSATRL